MYIYHLKSKKFIGDKIIPLNSIKNKYPDLYDFHIKKYKGREDIMRKTLPEVNCLWNDVIHCSPINIKIVYSKLEELGYEIKSNPYWFKIPIENISELQVVRYHNVIKANKISLKDFKVSNKIAQRLDLDDYAELSELPKETIEYYKKCKEEDSRPLLFLGVPHILVKGEIDISECEIESYRG